MLRERLIAIGACAAVLAAAIGTGWVLGAAHEQKEAARFEGLVHGLGMAATRRAQQIATRQDQINEETNHAHDAGRAVLRAHYRGLRHPTDTHRGTVPDLPAPPEPSGSRPTDAGPAAAEPQERLAERCAETTLMFIDLRNAWRDQTELGALP